MNSILLLTSADRLRLMIHRSYVWPDERDDIALVLKMLSRDPTDPEVDHPLVDLYRAPHFYDQGEMNPVHF